MTNKFSCFLTQKGRWLTATLFLLFTMGIGQMWGATSTSPATVTFAGKTFLNVAATDANARIKDADSTLAYNAKYLQTTNPDWLDKCSDGGSTSTSSMSGLKDAGFLEHGSNNTGDSNNSKEYSALNKIRSDRPLAIYVTGITSVAMVAKGAGTSSNKWIGITVEEVTYPEDTYTLTNVALASNNKNYSSSCAMTSVSNFETGKSISPDKYYKVSILGGSENNMQLWQVRFGKPVTITVNPTGGSTSTTGWTLNEGKYIKAFAYGTSVTLPTMTKSGASFDGWKDSHDNAIMSPLEVTKDTTLVAQWAAACTKPGTPGTPSAGSTATHNSATLTWTAAANSNGYKISVVKKSDASVIVDWTDCATNSYAASGLSPETTYTFKVKAKGATGYCELGDEASADFATEVDPSATTYKVTLVPAGGTISDATGWTLNAGNYEKEVSDGTELALPIFTKANRTFKTWRNGAVDVTSPITVTADVTLTAVWNATVENVIYSWESPSGTVIETGGTAVTYKGDDPVDGDPEVNVLNNGNYVLQVSGDNTASSSKNHIRITLTSGNAVKSGDKVKLIAYANNPSNNTRPRMIDGSGNQLCVAGSNMPAYTDPYVGTLTVGDGINTELIKLTRASGYTGTNTMVKKLQIVRDVQVEEANLRTVTFNYNDGGATASTTVELASGSKVAAPADPTYAHHRFHEWQLGGVTYDFASEVTGNITLVADWTQLYTVTYAKGATDATGDAPTQDELAAGEKFTVAANTFAYDGHDFSTWNDGSKNVAPNTEYTMGSANVTLTAQWITATTKATVTYKDGETTLDTEDVTIGNAPTAAIYTALQTKNLATFDAWYSDPDLAEAHKITDMSAQTISAATTYYGKWTYSNATSVNIEQWILTNGAGKGATTKTSALISLLGTNHFTSNLGWVDKNLELDSLSDKSDRNEPYLGLKVKVGGKMIDFRVANGHTVKVKFGAIKSTLPQVQINGEGSYTNMTITDGVWSYTATGNDYISIKMADDNAVVFKQIMIDADPVVVMPAINYASAEHGSISGLPLGIPGETITVTTTPESGYVVSAVTVNDAPITPVAGVYSFEMPSVAANVAATFAVYTPPTYSVTYNANNGSSDMIVDTDASVVADNTSFSYAGHIFTSWNTQADGNGVAYAVGAAVTENLELFAQWLEFTGCYYFGAKSVAADEAITTTPADLDNVYGGSMEATSGTFTYTSSGVLVAGGSSSYLTVTLDYALMEGSKIYVKMYAGNTSARGLYLRVGGSSENLHSFSWTPSASEPAQMLFEEEYEVPANSPLIGKKVFYLYRNNNVYLQMVTVKNCAPQDYTVTYMDGAKTLGTEMVYEGYHPTANGVYSKKQGYNFLGWKETADGAVVNLNDIVIAADKVMYAAYEAVTCPANGVMFSLEMDELKAPTSNVYYPNVTPAVGDMDVYATVSGGIAQAVNATNKKIEIHPDAQLKLAGNGSHLRILLDCPLAKNDTIKFAKDQVVTISFDSLKTKSVNVANGTSYYIVPVDYAGEDSIHLWYNGSGVQLTKVQVIRPEVYSVSFDLMGHGSAITPIDVVKGGKISAPSPAPTDANYSFAGWYKENTLSNAWDFDNDVVESTTILYAKWVDLTDATLKSLKYGENDVVLEDGIYVYNINLPALTTAVPALTAETSNPGASAAVANAAAFDGEGHATSIVTVTPEKVGAPQQVYTVNFSKAAAVTLQNVTGSITWNFANAVTEEIEILNTMQVLANYAGVANNDGFKSDKLEAKGTKIMTSPKCVRANQMHFYTTVPGKLTVEYSNTGGKPVRYLYVNGVKYDTDGSTNTTKKGGDNFVFVPAGDVNLEMLDGEDASKELNIYTMTFNATPDHHRTGLNPSNIGTLCWKNNAVLANATLYELVGKNEYNKLVFDEVIGNKLVAGMPYIFVPENGNTEIKVFNTDSEPALTAPLNPGTGMMGTFVDLSSADGVTLWGNYVISKNHYIYVDSDNVTLKAYRAYITSLDDIDPAPAQQQNSNGAPRRRIIMGAQGEQVATDIENIVGGETPVKLMINGQIFILRAEKLYDATGRLVK